MRILLIAGLILSAGMAIADDAAPELSEKQLAAVAVLTPLAQEQVPGENGVMLAECIVLSAKRRELRKLAAADVEEPGDAITEIANKIIQRPAVTTCLTERLTSQ